jgi:hypothetical protein
MDGNDSDGAQSGACDEGDISMGSGAGAASGASPKIQAALDLVANAGPPVFERTAGGYFLVAKSTLLFATYAPMHTIEFVDGNLSVSCRLPKDGGGVCDHKTRVDFKDRIEWSNAMTHLRSTHKAFVRPEHKKAATSELAAAAVASAAASSRQTWVSSRSARYCSRRR